MLYSCVGWLVSFLLTINARYIYQFNAIFIFLRSLSIERLPYAIYCRFSHSRHQPVSQSPPPPFNFPHHAVSAFSGGEGGQVGNDGEESANDSRCTRDAKDTRASARARTHVRTSARAFSWQGRVGSTPAHAPLRARSRGGSMTVEHCSFPG